MYTGYFVVPPRSNPRSGCTTMSAPDNCTGITAWMLRAEAEWTEEPGSAESHMAGVPDANTTVPPPSTADRTPFGPDCNRRPVAVVENRTAARAGFAAAAASFTTRTSENPSTSAVKVRSTPGSRSRYVAVAPDTTGAVSVPGQRNCNCAPPRRRVTSAPSPPAENVVGNADAVGSNPPFAARRNVGSGLVQEPSALRTRCVTAAVIWVNVPLALAKTCVFSLRALAT